MPQHAARAKLFVSIRIHIENLINQIRPDNVDEIMRNIVHPKIDSGNTYEYKKIFTSFNNFDSYSTIYDITDVQREYGNNKNNVIYAEKVIEYLNNMKKKDFYLFLSKETFYNEIINLEFSYDSECGSHTTFEELELERVKTELYKKELGLEDCEVIVHMNAFS